MSSAVLRARFAHHRYGAPTFSSAEAVVGHFGCMQSQDFAMATWAIGRRVEHITHDDLGQLFAAGRFLRTHILRPTWHFVLPEDLGWTMRATASRVHRIMATHNTRINLTDTELLHGSEIIVKALTDTESMTRTQLADNLREAGIDARGTRLTYHLIHAELEQLIVNGPPVGGHHTYILSPPAVTDLPQLSEDDALARLARTYVRGHGPSQPADLSWWSSLTLTQSRHAFALADLTPVRIDGKEYWSDDTPVGAEPPIAALIPAFDECISYVNKPLDPDRYPDGHPDLARGGGLLFLDGVIGGTWNRKVKAGSVEIRVAGYREITAKQRRAIEGEAQRLTGFWGKADTLLRVQ